MNKNKKDKNKELKALCISLGGSILFNSEFLLRFKDFIKRISKYFDIIVIITGGGKIAREYIKIARELSLSQIKQDILGIKITEANSILVSFLLKAVNIKKPKELDLVLDSIKNKIKSKCKQKKIKKKLSNIFVGCGIKPNRTTDYDMVLFAEFLKKNNFDVYLLNISKHNFIYNKNPDKYKDAKPLKIINYDFYINMFGKKEFISGINIPFDMKATRLARKNKFNVFFCDNKLNIEIKHIINKDFNKYKGSVLTFNTKKL